MARALDLMNLTGQPEAYRDASWEHAFFHALQEGKVVLDKAEAQAGPDGWPYLFVRTQPDATEPTVRVIDWLSSRGIGLAINAHKQVPDYIFTYGMIWNFKERGEFVTAAKQAPTGEVRFEKGQTVLAGQPTKDYLPDYVRTILSQFLEEQGVKEPKILVLSTDKKHFDLCFSLESLGGPQADEHQGIAEALSWFLPQHYSILLTSEKGLPQFYPLQK